MEQLSMFDLMEPAPVLPAYVEPSRREVMTRAYGRDYSMRIIEGDPDPIEVDVDGTPCLIAFGFGFSTYTLQPPGTLFWSTTGFRSFTNGYFDMDKKMFVFVEELDTAINLIRKHISDPGSAGGCGGRLVRWWPGYVLQWRQNVAFHHHRDRSTFWTQWGPDEHARIWAQFDAKQDEAINRMVADGIDPNYVGPPADFKGAWPKFTDKGRTA